MAAESVTVSAAGTVIVAVPGVAVGSATEVAVIVAVCAELVAAGAVNVAEVVVYSTGFPRAHRPGHAGGVLVVGDGCGQRSCIGSIHRSLQP